MGSIKASDSAVRKQTIEKTVEAAVIDTPLGRLGLRLSDGALAAVDFLPSDAPLSYDGLSAEMTEIVGRFRRYFAGDAQAFDGLAISEEDGTPFQKDVWRALKAIPYGQTRSYAEIARQLNKPGASRAIGQANRRNPLPIVVPCHRVITADGGLGGYQGTQGLEVKRALLALESSKATPSRA
ncbi:MAG: methylated-DNA--[protein]-cysteine S-methyltransferase [Vampirovibrionales bacterium]|nr:methylated-DNA--[protein]-cysteine S-methyltransferase [Vampirovibrionales bacterium]